MQKANQIVQAIRKLGEERQPLTRVYRSLFSEDLFLTAYDNLRGNSGALTPGTNDETIDGMSVERIRQIIDELRNERFKFNPNRRVKIAKKSGGTRPLGVPNFKDKLVQEALRIILDAYYEPRFKDTSHGFREGRGCHTALTSIHHQFQGTTWFIEGDIRGCFDNIDHTILMQILSRDIQDGRLLNLIRMGLEAGYVEDWVYHKTYSGTPQGGVLSPLLSNIYMHELDSYIEDTLLPQYSRGKKRAGNREYKQLTYHIEQARIQGQNDEAQVLEQQRRLLPSQDTQDPNYRRLAYVRYADDFIVGFIGPKSEADIIKTQIHEFLREKLHLELSETKTLITHGRTEHARFLGYSISIYHADDKLTRHQNVNVKKRSINGGVRLGLPHGLITEKAAWYKRKGKVISEAALLAFSDAHIIDIYQQRFRGIAEYYKYAVDRHELNSLKYVMSVSLTKTLAHKYRISCAKVVQQYRSKLEVNGERYSVLQVIVPTSKGSRTIYWGGIPLKVIKVGSQPIKDVRYREQVQDVRSDLIRRLQANTCEICGKQTECQVHHIRKLSNLKERWAGRKQKPEWVIRMIAIQRKTLIVCVDCHKEIHSTPQSPSKHE
ncbi:MAG: reverse transcriptase/maturase family protein [Aggregatilineales bacterium]